jgi:LytS/YehU family sensor histidine kinase
MQPHFLMNCLTQLMELIEVKPKHAAEFIVVLSDEFRQLTEQSDKSQVPLSDEIKLCNNHLAIMSFRYQQSYQLIIDGDVSNILIPSSILHSQIENCFTHNEISSVRAFELIVSTLNGRITLLLKTPIETRIDHQGTGLGERYIKAKLAEIDEVNKQSKQAQASTFVSYEEQQYWVSKYSFDELKA